MAYYLLLEFKDAGLILDNKSQRPKEGWKHALNEFGVNSNVPTRNIDYDTPIGVSQVSNMLHVMFGLAPKPTYRRSAIERCEQIYEIAKKARIRYYDACDENIYEKSEVLSTAKYQVDSHRTPKARIGDKIYLGVYSWSYLSKWLTSRADEEFSSELFSVLSEVLECDDVRKTYMFEDAVLGLRKFYDDEIGYYNDERLIDFFDKHGEKKIVNFIGSHYACLLFGRPHNSSMEKSSNTPYKYPTPLLIDRGVSQRVAKLSGEILVEIDDETLVERLHQVGILPTLLDGGIVTVMSLEKWKPDPIDYAKFKEISEQHIPEGSEKQ
jgi:hypothetical protein